MFFMVVHLRRDTSYDAEEVVECEGGLYTVYTRSPTHVHSSHSIVEVDVGYGVLQYMYLVICAFACAILIYTTSKSNIHKNTSL